MLLDEEIVKEVFLLPFRAFSLDNMKHGMKREKE
jgi:hypothetical protein